MGDAPSIREKGHRVQARPDAVGMRFAASQFRSKADRLGVVLGRLDGQVGSMTYAGPSADQFRAAMAEERGRLAEIMQVLGRVSDLLNDGAARVDADPLGFYGFQSPGGTS